MCTVWHLWYCGSVEMRQAPHVMSLTVFVRL